MPKHILKDWPQPVTVGKSLLSPVIKYLLYSFQVSKETPKTTMEVQKSSASWDSSGMALEEEVAEKPETRLGCLSSRAGVIQKEPQPVAAKRYGFVFFFCFLNFLGHTLI